MSCLKLKGKKLLSMFKTTKQERRRDGCGGGAVARVRFAKA